MKKNYLLMIALVAIVVLGAACSKDETSQEKDVTANLKITTNISEAYQATRSVVTSFSNSTIGVFVDYASGIYNPTVNSIANVTTGGSTVSPTPAIYINADAKVYAWYPASENELENPASNSTKVIEVLGEDTFGSESQIDYLWATPTDVDKFTSSANLAFNHALTKVVFRIKIGENFEGNGILKEILLSSDETTPFLSGNGTMAISDGGISGLTPTNSLKYTGNETITTTGSDIITLVAPVELDDKTAIKFTIDDKVYSALLPVSTISTWVSGTSYTYNITVDGVELYINNVVSINDWSTGDSTDIDVK